MKRMRSVWLVLAVPAALCGCSVSVNKSVALGDGKIMRASHHMVNGNVTIGANCDVRGTCASVNGGITVGPDSRIDTVQTVNGPIELGERVLVRGGIASVNGLIRCHPGVEIERDIASVNGKVELTGTAVARDIRICNAYVTLLQRSTVAGDIIIRGHDHGHSDSRHRVEIHVADGSIIKGDIVVRDTDADVAVYLAEGGTVQGRIEGATVFR